MQWPTNNKKLLHNPESNFHGKNMTYVMAKTKYPISNYVQSMALEPTKVDIHLHSCRKLKVCSQDKLKSKGTPHSYLGNKL